MSSDSVMQTFTRWPALKPITEQFPESENEAFMTIAYTIGAMMVFPGNKIDGKLTINGARGFNRSIADRFDLTLECIRRHYLDRGQPARCDALALRRLLCPVRRLPRLRAASSCSRISSPTTAV